MKFILGKKSKEFTTVKTEISLSSSTTVDMTTTTMMMEAPNNIHNHNSKERPTPEQLLLLQQQQQQQVATVCCGCRPKATKSKQRRFRKASWSAKQRMKQPVDDVVFSSQHSTTSSKNFQDAMVGSPDDWANLNDDKIDKADDDEEDTNSLYYFDAVEEFDERFDGAEYYYPVVITNYLEHPKPVVSMEDPSSLLEENGEEPPKEKRKKSVTYQDEVEQKIQHHPIASHQQTSQRFLKIRDQSFDDSTHQLKHPPVKTPVPQPGYPGHLTMAEMQECLKFLQELQELQDTGVAEQIYSFRDVEAVPYTICRWLRAMKFDATKILARCVQNQPQFQRAQAKDFYPDVSEAIGAPFSVFLSQYPFLPIGHAKNGCPVNYFQAGKINPEGIMALTTTKRLEGYFWWSFMWKFKQEIRKAQTRDPDFVHLEGISVIDLQGLSASALSTETMHVIQLASQVSDFFPETLHCLLVINAPGFFALSWRFIKKFIDPRTASRVQVFSSGNSEKATKRLQQLIDMAQIPVDYGGDNKSVEQAFREEASDPTLLQQHVELVHCHGKKKIKTVNDHRWKVAQGEYMDLTVYTRSVTTVQCTVSFQKEGSGDKVVVSDTMVTCEFEQPSEDDDNNNGHLIPKPTGISLMPALSSTNQLAGPGQISISFQEIHTDIAKEHAHHSKGYFLLVGDIKKLSS